MITIEFDDNVITIESNSIQSNLHETGDNCELYNAAIDGIESLILALSCAGIDAGSKEFVGAVKTAVDACANNL